MATKAVFGTVTTTCREDGPNDTMNRQRLHIGSDKNQPSEPSSSRWPCSRGTCNLLGSAGKGMLCSSPRKSHHSTLQADKAGRNTIIQNTRQNMMEEIGEMQGDHKQQQNHRKKDSRQLISMNVFTDPMGERRRFASLPPPFRSHQHRLLRRIPHGICGWSYTSTGDDARTTESHSGEPVAGRTGDQLWSCVRGGRGGGEVRRG